MCAHAKDLELQLRIARRTGRSIPLADARTLRRAALTLHRWAELECGDGDDRASWAIERDEDTGIPYRCVYPHVGPSRRHRIPDRERGAWRRVLAVCLAHGLHAYHQPDPRGASLYVSERPITATDYPAGVAI